MFKQPDNKMTVEAIPFPKDELRFILENLGALAEEVDATTDERAKLELIRSMTMLNSHLGNLLNRSFIIKTERA